MIPLSLTQIADVVAGEIVGAPDVTVDGPVVIDGRQAAAGSLFVAFVGEHSDGHDHAAQAGRTGAVAVLGSRPTELPTVVVADVQVALQQLAAHVLTVLRADSDLTVVAITGSQGKTSTKDVLAAILSRSAPTVATHGSYNNELGVPLTVLRATHDTAYLVLEMGARGIGHITELTDIARPDVSVVLNVGSAHLGEFGSREAIATAKGELVGALPASGTAVLNADDALVDAMGALTAGHVVRFGTGEDADVRVSDVTTDGRGRPTFRLHTVAGTVEIALHLVGAHQVLNAAAAAAAALAAGATLDDVTAGLTGVEALSQWRMELHELDSGVTVLNDSYNANPESMRAALDAVTSMRSPGGRVLAVLGEMRELGPESDAEHVAVGAYAAEHGVDHLVVIGSAARGIHEATTDRSTFVPDNPTAAGWLAEHLRSGDVVLFKASRGARLDEVAASLLG